MKDPGHRLFGRRRLLAFLTASVGVLARGADAKASSPVTTMDYCYWRNEQSWICYNGTRYDKWCYICNDPGTGWTVYRCERRPNGPC